MDICYRARVAFGDSRKGTLAEGNKLKLAPEGGWEKQDLIRQPHREKGSLVFRNDREEHVA